MVDTWDQWGDLYQDNTKELCLKYRNEYTYKVTITENCKCWAKDLSRGAVLDTELLYLHRHLQEFHLPYLLYQQPSWIAHSPPSIYEKNNGSIILQLWLKIYYYCFLLVRYTWHNIWKLHLKPFRMLEHIEIILKDKGNDALYYFSKSLANAPAQTIKGNAIQTTSGREFTRLAAASQQTDAHQNPTVVFIIPSLQHLAEISQESKTIIGKI